MVENHHIFERYPELKEFVRLIRQEVQQAQRPASEIILSDQQVMDLLTISKRRLQYMKTRGEIPYSRIGTRTYFILQDVLDILQRNRVQSIENHLKIPKR